MKSISTSVATLSLIDQHIIAFRVHDHATFGLNEMLEVREANLELSEGKPYCVMMEAGAFANFTKEAREASASPEHTKNRIALALVQDNLAIKMITEFYLKINKPVGATKAFRNREEALKWLVGQRDTFYLNK